MRNRCKTIDERLALNQLTVPEAVEAAQSLLDVCVSQLEKLQAGIYKNSRICLGKNIFQAV